MIHGKRALNERCSTLERKRDRVRLERRLENARGIMLGCLVLWRL